MTYRSLDTYRFIAALLVVIGHFDDGFRLGLAQITPLATRFGLAVDFFFILSGFVIAANYAGRINSFGDYGDFLWRRIARLFPVHLLVLAALCGFLIVATLIDHGFTNPDTYRLADLPANLLLLNAWGAVWRESFNVPSWSISAELLVYMLFPLLVWQARRWPLALNLVLVAALVLIMALARDRLGLRPWHQATYDLGALRALPSFLLGILIEHQLRKPHRRIVLPWPMVHGCFVLALIAIHINAPAELVVALFGAFVFLAASAERAAPTALPFGAQGMRLGEISYALYMIHLPLMTVSLVLLRPMAGYEGAGHWLFAIGTLGAAIALAFAIHRFYEAPARLWLNVRSPFRGPRLAARAS